MDNNLSEIKSKIYDKCGLRLSGFEIEPESATYDACRFQLNDLNIIHRTAKTTPKKSGQFVTFWKRKGNGPIEPFCETDAIDFFEVVVRTDTQLGQFVFPKSVLMEKGIITTDKQEGKRAFRVYPPWDNTNNSQAERTQKWQSKYFYEITISTDLRKVKELYSLLQ